MARRKHVFSKAPQHEEIRFAKIQQRVIAVGGIATIVGIYQIANSVLPKPISTNGTLLVLSVMLIAVLLSLYLMWSLQQHLAAKRRELIPDDVKAFSRGLDHVGIYVFAMVACSALLLIALFL